MHNATLINYSLIDQLSEEDPDGCTYLRVFLTSLELLARQFSLIKREKYIYRTQYYNGLELYVNELPRSAENGSLFHVKTFLLSTKTPSMLTRKGHKVVVSKEFFNSASKFHFVFNDLFNFINNDLTDKLYQGDEIYYNSSGVVSFFKTVLGGK